MKKSKKDNHLIVLLCFTVCVLLFLYITLGGRIFNLYTLSSMALQISELGVIAIGMALTILIGCIDLSIVANANLSGILAALLLNGTLLRTDAMPETLRILLAVLLPLANALTHYLLAGLDWLLDTLPLVFGAAVGLCIWPCVTRGLYHKLLLPLILIEIGQVGFSYFGAADMVCLVVVSAGLTLSGALFGRAYGSRELAVQGFRTNVLFGTLIEASYPFIQSNRWIRAAVYLSSAFGGALTALWKLRGTAYIPVPLAPLCCERVRCLRYALCILAVFALTFLLSGAVFLLSGQHHADRVEAH